MGACSSALPQHSRCHQQLAFGLESHMKGRVDGKMDTDDTFISARASAGKYICSVVDAINVLQVD